MHYNISHKQVALNTRQDEAVGHNPWIFKRFAALHPTHSSDCLRSECNKHTNLCGGFFERQKPNVKEQANIIFSGNNSRNVNRR